MPTANEVFQAAKRGQNVKHRNMGEARYRDGALCWKSGDGWSPVLMGETELDETAWSIEPAPDIFAGLDARIAELKKAIDELEYMQRATLAANGENVK